MEFSAKPFAELSIWELYELLRLRSDVFVVEQGSPYPDPDGRDYEAVHLLGRQDGRLLACARWFPAGPWMVLGRIAVHPSARGAGWGRRVMEEALARIGERPVRLHAQVRLVAFYLAFGFEPAGEPYDDYGIAHQEMSRGGAASRNR
jgi:ElaA protein